MASSQRHSKEFNPISDEERQYLLELMQKAFIPGMSIATISGGELAWSGSLGLSNAADKKSDVNTNTQFSAASLSKPVFAYLVAKLIENEILPQHFLTQPLHEYLPAYKPFFLKETIRFDDSANGQALTAELVLSHRTGLPNWIRSDSDAPFLSTPGEAYSYSGEGFHYLQRVIENKTKQSLQELAKKYVFDPLGMSHSTFVPPAPSENIALGHDEIMAPHPSVDKPEENAGASLYTTASDYARFLAACIDKLEVQFAPFLNPVVTMTEDKQACKKKISEDTLSAVQWSLGWGIQKTPEGMVAWHWGDNLNFKAFAAINLTLNSGIVFFTNSQNGLSIAQEVITPVVGNVKKGLEYLFQNYDYVRNDTPGWNERIEGQTAEAQGDYVAALIHFKKAHDLAPADKTVQTRIAWINELIKCQAKPIKLTQELIQYYEGQYGFLKVTNTGDQLQTECAGKKYDLIPISDTCFLDMKNKVKVEFARDDKGMIFLTSHFLNGEKEALHRAPLEEKTLHPNDSLIKEEASPAILGKSLKL